MKKTILTILTIAVFVALTSFASASVGILLFYEDTYSNSFTIQDGEDIGFGVRSFGFLESYIITDVDLLDANGNKLVDLIDANTKTDFYKEKDLTKALYGEAGDYIIRATVKGSLGGTSTATLYLTVESIVVPDTTAPVITLTGASPQTIEVFSSYNELGATALDDVDGTVSVSINSAQVDTNALGTYTVYYAASDNSGNTATATRIVQVVDTTSPVITLIGANPQSILLGENYVELGATATDNYDSVGVSIDSSKVNTNALGSYNVFYTTSDNSGNSAITKTRTVRVYDVSGPPVITVITPQAITYSEQTMIFEITVSKPVRAFYSLDGGADIEMQGEGNDDEIGDAKISFLATDFVSEELTLSEGEHTVTFIAKDSDENTETETVVFTIDESFDDTTAPVITLIGLQIGSLLAGSVITEMVFFWPGLGQLSIESI